MIRIGMLTSGGDCQSLNATMRGVAKSLYKSYGDEVEIIGFEDGYKGLIYADYRIMKPSDFSGILTSCVLFFANSIFQIFISFDLIILLVSIR